MQLVIKGVGVEYYPNIRNWHPEDPKKISTYVMVDIGVKSRKGSDSFIIRLATPDGLKEENAVDGVIANRPLIIMNEYSFDDFWRWLERTVKSCEADTWLECIAKLEKYFDWEFDYIEDSDGLK